MPHRRPFNRIPFSESPFNLAIENNVDRQSFPDSGIAGAVSAKALLTRLFDMDMYSKQIEKIYKDGAERRFRLINSQRMRIGKPLKPVEIEYNRTTPSDFEDRLNAIKGVTVLSNRSLVEYLGYDWEDEKKRIEEEMGGDSQINQVISDAMRGEDDVQESVIDGD